MNLQALEEGRAYLEKIARERNISWKRNMYVRAYICFIGWFFILFTLRPAIVPEKRILIETPHVEDHSTVYSHMKSNKVQHIDDYIKQTIEKIQTTMEEKEYKCLAAIHVGIPMAIVQVDTDTFINPNIVLQGSSVSKAYETSAFYPEREAVLMTRFVPVELEGLDIEGKKVKKTFNKAMAHCVLHMMNQLEGRNIYDNGF